MDAPQRHQLEYASNRNASGRFLRSLILVAIAVVLTFLLLLVSAPLFHSHRHVRPSPTVNLKQIASAVTIYALEYGDGHFPESLEAVVRVEPGLLLLEVFTSPNGPATPALDYETLFSEPGHISYVWLGTGLTFDSLEADTPLAYEGPVTDFEAGALVLFGNHKVRRVQGDELRKLIEEAEERLKRAATGLATQPATQSKQGAATNPGTTRASSSPALDAARQELEAVFAERVRATKKKDADALVAMISPDYSAELPDGRRVGYDEIIAYLGRGTEQFIEVKDLSIRIEKLELRGEQGEEPKAVVDARQRFARTQRLADGQVHEVYTTVLQKEVWVRRPAGWQLRSVSDLREQQFLVDGQPVEQGGR